MDINGLNRLIRSSMCEHNNVEHIFEDDKGQWPIYLSTTCEDCGKDVRLTDAEIILACEDYAINQQSNAVDLAVDDYRDQMAGIAW